MPLETLYSHIKKPKKSNKSKYSRKMRKKNTHKIEKEKRKPIGENSKFRKSDLSKIDHQNL